jgi:hypothetical protein
MVSSMLANPCGAAGEMAKFSLAPFGTVFSALKVMLDDFVGANVDAVAELLDTAGRFLYRLPETHVRMANMAEVTRHTANSSAHAVLSGTDCMSQFAELVRRCVLAAVCPVALCRQRRILQLRMMQASWAAPG